MLSDALRRADQHFDAKDVKRFGVRAAANEIGKVIASQNRAFDYPRFMKDANAVDGSNGQAQGPA